MSIPTNDLLLLWLREHAQRIRAEERRARSACGTLETASDVRVDRVPAPPAKRTTYRLAIEALAETHAKAALVYDDAIVAEEERLGLRLRCACEPDELTLSMRRDDACWTHGRVAAHFRDERTARMCFEVRRSRGFVLRRADASAIIGEPAWIVCSGSDRGWDFAVLVDGGTREEAKRDG